MNIETNKEISHKEKNQKKENITFIGFLGGSISGSISIIMLIIEITPKIITENISIKPAKKLSSGGGKALIIAINITCEEKAKIIFNIFLLHFIMIRLIASLVELKI